MTPPSLAAPVLGRTGVQVADRPPTLRPLPPEDPGDPAPARPQRRLPKHLYYPTPAMKTIWCRFHFDGTPYRQSTGCRDVRNAEAAARRIRAELEAELRGIAPPKRIKIEDAIKDFARSLAGGKGGPAQQAAVVKHVGEVLAHRPVRFVDELTCDIYNVWVEKAKRSRPQKPGGLAKWTIHKRAQAIRRFGKWLEDSDRVVKSPFRQVQLVSGKADAKVRRAVLHEEFNHLLASIRRRPIEDAARLRLHAGVSDRERVRLRKIGRRRALVLRTIARSGIRPKELRQITIAHVDPEDQTIFLPSQVAKARRRETVFLTADLARRLAALVRSMGPGPDSRLLFPDSIPNSRTFEQDIEAAGLPKEDLRYGTLCLYSMRKSFSSHLRDCGIDDDTIGRLMRHTPGSLNADVYTDRRFVNLREPMRLLDARDREERRKWRRSCYGR